MERPLRKIDLWAIEHRTSILKDWEKRILQCAEIINNDPHRQQRLTQQLCKKCFSGLGLAGQAFTKYYCGICEVELMNHNTNTPALCKDCAGKNNLCVHCAAQIDGKQKRKVK